MYRPQIKLVVKSPETRMQGGSTRSVHFRIASGTVELLSDVTVDEVQAELAAAWSSDLGAPFEA